ncbi:MAG: NAD(P)H-hydrate dehydratase [Gammaproteobacteria bacterium]|nr:NAD(P)H-hydrate dehydratase [Gammaproteobacteria bacterium]
MLPAEIYQSRQTRELDRIVIEQHGVPGIMLMRRAGEAAFARIMERYSGSGRMVVVCGPGNNGGDGYVVAGCARRIGMGVTVLAAAKPATADAATAARDYRDGGGAIVAVQGEGDCAALAAADLVVDALFGVGLSRAPQGLAARLVRAINDAGCPVVALDMPSGLHSDTGLAFSPCVTADLTVTFIGLKLGLLTGQGRSRAGRVVFEDLRIPPEARRAVAPVARIIAAPTLKRRALDMHKGDAGRVLVVGGGRGMLGAVLLAGEAALRCGSGLVTIASTEDHLDLAALRHAELMSADAGQLSPQAPGARADVLVLGPGLGQSHWSAQVFQRFIDSELPMVVDADGLNHLARLAHTCGDSMRRPSNRVLTPHPGEAARLLQSTTADIQADRPGAARAIAERFGGVCVLKGAGTLVVCAQGGMLVCDRGNPGMASAGMGDVLSGIAGALLAQGLPAMAAASAAVWLHASAADAAVKETGERGLLARDVIAGLAPLIRRIEKSRDAKL